MSIRKLPGLFGLFVILVLAGFAAPVQAAPNQVLTVKSPTDLFHNICAADCTLRDAISAANKSNAATVTIKFSIPTNSTGCSTVTGVCRIQLLGQLPSLKVPMTIDGYSQPGAIENSLDVGDDAQLRIILDGVGLPNVTGLVLTGGSSVVTGINFQNFSSDSDAAILISSNGNVIEGNFIGTDPDASFARKNHYGILIGGQQNRIGGVMPAQRNIISGNESAISVSKDRNRIEGNYIGTNRSGTAAISNVDGILLFSSHNRIGGAGGARNVISGNSSEGIALLFSASYNKITNNFIGRSATGGVLGNPGLGIFLVGDQKSKKYANNNLISKNYILYNGKGILLGDDGGDMSVGNAITRNTIFGNSYMGIDINPQNSVNLNDPKDTDDGPNHLQNYPEFTGLEVVNGTETITGVLHSVPDSSFRIELFANATCDGNGYGEGATYFAAVNVTTNHKGVAHWKYATDTPPDATYMTATATQLEGTKLRSTSEFSKCLDLS